jgi:hypothetical protein
MEAFTTIGRDPILKRIRASIRHAVGSWLEITQAPAKIREFEYVDQSTNETDGTFLNGRRAGLTEPVRHLWCVLATGRNSAISCLSRPALAAKLSMRSTKKWVMPVVGGSFRWD